MTTSPSGRVMPTLSLKGSVCVALFLFICSLTILPAAAMAGDKIEKEKIDKKNRSDIVVPFGEIMVADRALPDKVFEARLNTVQIVVIFYEHDKADTIIAAAGGSAFAYRPGLLISSAHVLQEPIRQLIEMFQQQKGGGKPAPAGGKDKQPQPSAEVQILNGDLMQNKTFPEMLTMLAEVNGTPIDYQIYGIISLRHSSITIPLTLAATTNPGSPKDLMALLVNDYSQRLQQSLLAPDPAESINPLAPFFKNAMVTDDVEIGQTVFLTGFTEFGLPYVFEAFVAANPVNAENTRLKGMKKPYVLRGSADHGFSGGPVLDREGRVIGISKMKSDNFLVLVSKKDIEEFLKASKLDNK